MFCLFWNTELQEMAVFLISKGCDAKQHDKHTKSPFEEAVLKKEAKVRKKEL